ncbi:MAG: sigma-70 family RNA polymerase sigma factor [Bryobacterales bacterium]|nr:sigma-70 family RNA polymerase sigma factor [Bryobacterales bacterium]
MSIDAAAEGTETLWGATLTHKKASPRDGSVSWTEADFERVFHTHYTRVATVILRVVGDQAKAECLASEVFWKLYRQPPAGTDDRLLASWLYRTAMRAGIDSLRAAGRRARYEQQAAGVEEAASDSPLENVLRQERCALVRAVLAELRPAQARILILRHSGFSYKELAATLGVKVGSVGSLLVRAEAAFEKQYRLITEEAS